MRKAETGASLKLRAIAGSHVVVLAWDFAQQGGEQGFSDLMGFAIERTEFDAAGKEVERYWLRGIKRFRDKDAGLPPGTLVPTSEHPVQSFQWGDYTTKPGTTYAYRVVPMRGAPKLLRPDEPAAVVVKVCTETNRDQRQDIAIRHDVHFNRGAAGSQAYARRFGDHKPDSKDPASEQMVWLSRGLFEALIAFIGEAKGQDYALHGMFYEFRYLPVGQAFRAAAERGAAVNVRYDVNDVHYKTENEGMIAAAGIAPLCLPQAIRSSGIRHNKFLVLSYKGEPVAVWTGSTNISAGGIFGHSNVGHAVWDKTTAGRYRHYWDALTVQPLNVTALKRDDASLEPSPDAGVLPATGRVMTLFSPRDTGGKPRTLEWYAALLKGAKFISCMTFPFNFDRTFASAMEGDTDSLNYLLFDKPPKPDMAEMVSRNGNTVIAAGAKLDHAGLKIFLDESLSGLAPGVRYIHTKYLLVDPLGDDPIVVTGSANFSVPSQADNDENMLVIRGDTRVADIYFGEFMRLFDHLYARYLLSLHKEGSDGPDAGYLKPTCDGWLPAHFQEGAKQLRRKNFMA